MPSREWPTTIVQKLPAKPKPEYTRYKAAPRRILGIRSGSMKKLSTRSLAKIRERCNPVAAKVPIAVATTDDATATGRLIRKRESRNSARLKNFSYHLNDTAVVGILNAEVGLNDTSTTTTIGANRKTNVTKTNIRRGSDFAYISPSLRHGPGTCPSLKVSAERQT